MRILVLIKQVPDTAEERRLDLASGSLDREASEPVIDEICERALEVALSYKESNRGTEVVVLSMGPTTVTTGLRKALSMGADSAIHVLDDDLMGADLLRTSTVLAAALRSTVFDLVLAGNESTDGRGGVIPAMIAEHLRLPHVSFLNSVEISNGMVRGERGTERNTVSVHASLPAIVSVTERMPDPRFPSFKGILTAKKKPLTVMALSDLGLESHSTFAGASRSVVVSTVERPARTAGKKIVDDGNAGRELAEFLAASRLI